jgi:hypothetical protein
MPSYPTYTSTKKVDFKIAAAIIPVPEDGTRELTAQWGKILKWPAIVVEDKIRWMYSLRNPSCVQRRVEVLNFAADRLQTIA